MSRSQQGGTPHPPPKTRIYKEIEEKSISSNHSVHLVNRAFVAADIKKTMKKFLI